MNNKQGKLFMKFYHTLGISGFAVVLSLINTYRITTLVALKVVIGAVIHLREVKLKENRAICEI